MAHLEVSGNHYYSLLLIYLSVIFLLLIIICEQIIISLIKISNTKIMRFSYKPDKKAHHTVLHFTLYHICMICKAQAKKLVMIWMTADCISLFLILTDICHISEAPKCSSLFNTVKGDISYERKAVACDQWTYIISLPSSFQLSYKYSVTFLNPIIVSIISILAFHAFSDKTIIFNSICYFNHCLSNCLLIWGIKPERMGVNMYNIATSTHRALCKVKFLYTPTNCYTLTNT